MAERKSPFEYSSPHGRSIGRKRKKNITKKDFAVFCCPRCGNGLKVDLIRLRHDLCECRKCNNIFIKENITDELDFDYE